MRRSAQLGWVLASGLAAAGASAQSTFVIGPGREDEVLALFAPHALGSEVTPGWTLSNVSIEQASIEATLTGADAPCRVVLAHRGRPSVSPPSASFSLRGEGAAECQSARAALLAAVRRNDDGAFWQTRGLVRSAPRLASQLADIVTDPPARGAPSPERVTGGAPRIDRASGRPSAFTALLALLVATGSLLLGRGGGRAVDAGDPKS